MSLLRSSPAARLCLGLLATAGLLTVYSQASGNQHRHYMVTNNPNFAELDEDSFPDIPLLMDNSAPPATGPIGGLQVLLSQKTTDSPSSAPILEVKVTNTNLDSVTILSYSSPLDDIALQLGLIQITPAGQEPLPIPSIEAQRQWPPEPEALITIAAGESHSQEIELREDIVPRKSLGSRPIVQLKGKWHAVWPLAKDTVNRTALKSPHSDGDAFSGSFKTNPLAINLS